jgi:hypothetical protein
MVKKKPPFIWRLFLIVAIAGFASIDNNPLVKLEAELGLSPSPIERIFSVKSLFSGMTEGVFQFIHMNIGASIQANIFAPLVIPLVSYSILAWRIPKVDTKKKEYVFFSGFVFLSMIVNIVN